MPIKWGPPLPPDDPIFDGRIIFLFRNAPAPEPGDAEPDESEEEGD